MKKQRQQRIGTVCKVLVVGIALNATSLFGAEPAEVAYLPAAKAGRNSTWMATIRAEGRNMVRFVVEHRRLPAAVKPWVDDAFVFVKGAASAARHAKPSEIAAAGRIGGGALAVVAGSAQVDKGVAAIRSGREIEGSLDVGSGTAMTAGGVAMAVGSTSAGVGAIGVAATVEGAKDIYLGVRSGDDRRTAIGSAKAVGGGLMIAGAATANPVVAGTGAAVYTGAVVCEHEKEIRAMASRAARASSVFVREATDDILDALRPRTSYARF